MTPVLSALTVTLPTFESDVPTIEPVSIEARMRWVRGDPPIVALPILLTDREPPIAPATPAPTPPPMATALAPADAVIVELSLAQTVTSLPAVVTVLLRMRASTVLAIVLKAADPAPLTAIPAPPPAPSEPATPMATTSMRAFDVAWTVTGAPG